MQKLITAKEAREISDNMSNAMNNIKDSSIIGNTECQSVFHGNDEEIKQYIEKLKELGYKITNIADGSINEKYLTIEW